MTAIRVVSFGTEQVNEKFNAMGVRASNAAPFFTEVLIPDMERIEEQMFMSQGRRGGGSWKMLSPGRVKQKAAQGLDPRINIATFNLLQSLVDSEEPDAVRKVTGWKLTFGSVARGAVQSQKFRPIVRFTKFDRVRWARWLGEYVVEAKA
jgi:hypothetical protein